MQGHSAQHEFRKNGAGRIFDRKVFFRSCDLICLRAVRKNDVSYTPLTGLNRFAQCVGVT